MAAPRLALAVAFTAAMVLFAPVASAATAHGALQVSGLAQAPGPSTLDAAHGALQWNASDVPTLQLKGASFTVETWGEDDTVLPSPVPGGVGQHNVLPVSTTDYGAGALTLEKGTGLQWLVLDSPASPLHAAITDATLKPVRSILLAPGPATQQNLAGCTTKDCAQALGAYELTGATTKADLAGDKLLLFLHGPTAVLTVDGQPTRITTGSTSTQAATMQQTHDAWALITIQKPTGTLDASHTTWYLASPILHAAQAVAQETTGDVRVGLESYRATQETLDVRGALTLVPASVESDKPSYQPHYATGFDMQIQGDVTSINLHAAPVYAEPASAAGGLLGLAVLAGIVAYLWPRVSFHLTASALPLYTRLKQPEILANEVRNSIYEIIRAHPGISAREVHRQSEQSWGTVVYHLRQLERHHLVVSRSVGRTRNYYENHGKYRGMEVQLACLQSARARALAHLVDKTPGITQEDLATQSGFPQPTTSYYVRKLKAAALVEERRDGRYARYHPGPELTRFLQLADSNPTEPKVGFSDGVQA